MHWGLPRNMCSRAGRDGEDAEAILFEAILFQGETGHYANEEMKAEENFYKITDVIQACKCCDVCANSCKCSECGK
ncbi:MAG: hypothetical protein A6F71_08605 [Cycloclasticus sp. symbiont of Poecilosclerida sp. M]|nr:MAG: hypothetical protein A6F71_08605 [Cycloclasticus sp. symbiont of Poecilosclerida sp. M]